MKEIFYFDSMLTPKIITVVYWFLLLSALIAGVSAMFFGENSSFLGGLVVVIGGLIFSRIWCELLIVLFKINENLQSIVNKSE
jgi:urea transporter